MTRCAAVGIRMTLFASAFAYTVTALVLPPLLAFVREYPLLVAVVLVTCGVAVARWWVKDRREIVDEDEE